MRKQVDEVNQNPAQASAEVLETMHAILHLFRSQQLRGVRDARHDLAHMEIKTLGFFARHPGASQSDLVSHSGRDKAQVARLIRSLRERGLLDARTDELDRRSTRLQLTGAGRELHLALHSHDGELAEQALRGLSADERAALRALLARVRTNLDAGQG